jgi:hypothetical protein
VSERALARVVASATVAIAIGWLFYVWAELNWKNLGNDAAVAGVTLGGAVLGALWAFRLAGRATPIDWIHELVRTAMLATLVAGVGALVAHLGDLVPPGQAELGNNQPNVWSSRFVTLLVAATLVATSSVLPIWRHRHAVRVYGDRPLAETLAACGAWLSGVAFVFAAIGAVVEADLARPFVPVALFSLLLIASFALVAQRRASRSFDRSALVLAASGTVLGAVTLVFGLTDFPLVDRQNHRDRNACRAADHPGLFLDARSSRVTAYQARGVALRRVECRTTFQYNDERHIAVVGRDAEERDHQGVELFVRVVGTPLERARAACEILLADHCETPLAYPSEISGLAVIPEGGVLVPHERAGRLAFFAVTNDYPHGRGTTLGRRRVVVAHEVDLSTGRLLDARDVAESPEGD